MPTMVQLEFDEKIYDTIRHNIKKYRKLKKITSAELAEMVDLSHDFIRQIQSEKAGYNFSVDTFYKISVALGVSMDPLCPICGRADGILSQIILDDTTTAEQIPKDARGRFILHDGTLFQSYWFDEHCI